MRIVNKSSVAIVAIFSLFTIVPTIYYTFYYNTNKNVFFNTDIYFQQFSLHKRNHVLPGDYLVSNPQCKILNIDPWDESIRPFIHPVEPVICSQVPPLTYVENRKNVGNVLKIDETMAGNYKHGGNPIDCCYSIIHRISQDLSNYTKLADKQYKLSPCRHFDKEKILSNTTEFIYVRCHTRWETYKNVHAVVPLLPKVLKKLEKFQQNEKKTSHKRLNVMIVGLDSVSRLNVRRTMPKTLDYLQRNDWVELNGYNKIESNTFPNVMAILSGENYDSLWYKCSINQSIVMDFCPIIWREFTEKGYITVYGEDAPDIGTFNYRKTGFVEQPTDYYLRPFMVASIKLIPDLQRHEDLETCIGSISSADHVFNYAKSFTKLFSNHSYFGLFWINRFGHDDVNLPSAIDFRLTHFLKDLEVYEDTLVLLLSDHGRRFGPISNTFVGYYEDRLPFIFIWVPHWFREKYPTKYSNLLTNRNRLTSPYDVYVTLKRLVDDDFEDNVTRPISKACPKCVSLFEEVPWERGCGDAGIEPQWCMCPNLVKINVSDPRVVELGKFFFQYIVHRTEELLLEYKLDKNLCVKRRHFEITRGYKNAYSESEESGDKKKMIFRDYYVIVIEVKPGFAIFEGWVQVNRTESEKPAMKVLNPTNRLDSYKLTSDCVQPVLLKIFCHCA